MALTSTALTDTYTSETEIERLITETGGSLRMDDLSDDADMWQEIVEEATDVVNQYAEGRYESSNMKLSSWVRRRATWIGAYLLSQRRGNPSQFNQRYQEILDELKAVAAGQISIPRLPIREELTPAHSNLVIDDRFHSRKIRVQRNTSTGTRSGQSDLDIPGFVE